MTFLAIRYLWVLPVVLIPIIIYLIFRRRRRDVPWGSMYILRRVLESRSRLRAWMQYLILALRTTALAALVAVFAQPTGSRPESKPDAFPAPPSSTHRILLLDTSGSMAARYESGTRLEAALSLCRKFLNSGRPPSQLDLLPLDGRDTPITCTALPLPQIRREELLAGCSSPAGTADLAHGLRTASRLFRASSLDHKELYVLTDFLRTDWRDPVELNSLLSELKAAGVAIHCLSYSPAKINNFSLLDWTANSDLLLAHQPTLFYLRVGYSGTLPSAETMLTVEADAGSSVARILRKEPLTLAPGEKTLVFPLELPAGRHTLTATVSDDDLAADNSLTRVFVVRATAQVAVVQDIIDAKGFENPRTWLQLALESPKAATDSVAAGPKINSTAEAYAAATRDAKNQDFKAADVAEKHYDIILQGKIPEQLNADLLHALDLVIVCGVSRMPPEATADLLGYVRQGGTLLLAPDPTTPPASFNQTYSELTPARLVAPQYRELDPERYEQCVTESPDYPMLRELESPEHGNLGNPRFYNWFTLQPEVSPEKSGDTLLSLTDGSPLLMERHIGSGSVLLWTAGLGQNWNSMVVHPAYPVFLMRLTNQAAARRQFPQNLTAGLPLLMPTETGQVRIVRPDGKSETVTSIPLGNHRFVRYEKTDVAGVYDLREDLASARPGILFTVSAALPESDLRPLPADVQARLEMAAGTPLHHSEIELTHAVTGTYPGRSWLWPAALLLALSIILEAALSRWFFA